MLHLRLFLSTLALTCALLLGVPATPTPAAPASTPLAATALPSPTPPPLAQVEPVSGTLQTIFRFSGTGFARNEDVAYWFTRPDGTAVGDARSFITRSDRNGTARWQWQPDRREHQIGIWVAVARGKRSGMVQAVRFELVPTPQQSP